MQAIVTLNLFLALTPASRAGAQTVQGIVVDAASGVPIDWARLAVVATDDSSVSRHITDSSGRFLIRVLEPGEYRLQATRIGYAPFTDVLVLARGQDVVVDIRLQPIPIALDPIESVVERPAGRLARVGFYERRAKGFGHFRTPQELNAIHPVFPEDLFWGMSGVRILRDGTVVSTTSHRRCALSVGVDGLVVQQGGRGTSGSRWTDVVQVNDVEAIEVYPGPGGVPVWLSGTVSPCGAIVVWTKGSSH